MHPQTYSFSVSPKFFILGAFGNVLAWSLHGPEISSRMNRFGKFSRAEAAKSAHRVIKPCIIVHLVNYIHHWVSP